MSEMESWQVLEWGQPLQKVLGQLDGGHLFVPERERHIVHTEIVQGLGGKRVCHRAFYVLFIQ